MNGGMWPSHYGPASGLGESLGLPVSDSEQPEITSNEDDYLPPRARSAQRVVLKLSSDAVRTLTGIRLRRLLPNQRVEILNVGSNAIVVAHEGGGSRPENRILSPITVLGVGTDVTIDPRAALVLIYDFLARRWRVVSFALDLI